MRKISLLLGFYFVLSSAQAQQASKAFSLFEAQEYALTNSEKVKNAQLDLSIAEKKVWETTAIGLPQVNFNGTFQNFINLPVQVVGANFINPNAAPDETIAFRAGTDYSVAGTLQATQLLFNGSYIVGLQVSRFYTQFAATNIEKSKEDVLVNVTQAYQMAVVAQSNLAFIDSLVLITEELITKQRNYLELGLMTQEDMDQLEYSLLTAKNNQSSARIQLQNAFAMLKMTMAFPQNESLSLKEDLKQVLANSVSFSGSSDLKNNLNFMLLSQQKTLDEYNLKNKKYQNLPVASAFFNQTYNAFRNEFNFFANEKWYPQTLWGVQLQIPIFASGSRWAQIEQAKLAVMKDENALTELERALQFQEIQAKNNLRGAQEQLLLQEANIELAKKIYENAIVKEQIGKGNSIVVSQKYNQLILSQAQYVGAVLDYFNAQLNLNKLYNNLQKK
jgi:outer membrane protein TolC